MTPQNMYDFFMRAAALFEQRAAQLAPEAQNIYVADFFKQAAVDAREAKYWAERVLKYDINLIERK